MALKRLLTISFVNLLKKKEQKSFRIIKHSRLKSFTVDIFFVLFSFHLVIKYISMIGCTECTLKLKSKQKSMSNMINLTTQNESLVFVFFTCSLIGGNYLIFIFSTLWQQAIIKQWNSLSLFLSHTSQAKSLYNPEETLKKIKINEK